MSLNLRIVTVIYLLVVLTSTSLLQGQNMVIESVTVKNVSCLGGDDGEITIEISGGQPPYTYTWIRLPFAFDQITTSETTVTFPGNFPITAATYLLDINDAEGNNAGGQAVVSEPLTAVEVDITPETTETCSGTDLQLNGNPTGGTPYAASGSFPYIHEWSGPGAAFLDATDIENPVFNNPAGGSFELTYTATDSLGCIATQTITINNTDNPETVAGSDDDICGSSYTLNATQSFGTGIWSASGPGTASFADVNDPSTIVTVDAFGTYTFTWTETNNGCEGSDDVDITFNENPSFALTTINPSSPGASDGSIEIVVNAGEAPFTYTLTNSEMDETVFGPSPDANHTFADLPAEIYNINVTDNKGCSEEQNRELTDTSVLNVDLQTTGTCNEPANGTLEIEILAGQSPFDVSVTSVPGGSTVFSTTASPDFNYLITDLAAGDYNVIIEDNAGNDFNQQVNITEGPSASISYPGSPFCGDGEALVDLLGFGGGTFSSSPSGLSINPANGTIDLTASNNGTYTVTYSFDDGDCAGTAETTVVIGEIADVDISYDESPYCQETGGVAPVTINGQNLNSSQNTYNAGRISSDHGFRNVTHTSNCPGSMTVSIPAGAVITAVDVQYQITSVAPHYMSDQRSQLRVVSPGGEAEDVVYTGLGNNPGTASYNRTGLTIANNVTGGGDIEFELHVGRTLNPTTSCNADWVWVVDGSWTVTVHYTSGHEFTAEPAGLDIDAVTGDIDLETSLAGDYVVTYSYNEGACEGTATAPVTILPAPEAPPSEDIIACYTGELQTLTLTPPTGASVAWYTDETGTVPASAPSGTDPGEYIAWASFILDGCESDLIPQRLTIEESPESPVPVNVTECADGSTYTATANVNPGDNIIWYANSTGDELASAPSDSEPGIYTAWAAAENNGCESERVEVTLTLFETPDAPEPEDFTTCYDGEVHTATAIPPAGATIVWYTSQYGDETTTAPSGTDPGVITAWAASSVEGECESEREEVTLTILPEPEAEISYGTGSFCAEGSVDVTITTTETIASQAFSVDPEDGLFIDENSGTINLAESTPGTYEIEMRFFSDNGCFNIAETTIVIEETPALPIAEDVTVCFDGTEHTASATPPAGASVVWYTDETGTTTTTAPNETDPGVYTAWAASAISGSSCESERVLVTLTIYETPDEPVANNVEACFDGTTHTASATPPAGASLVWYANATGPEAGNPPSESAVGTYTAYAASVIDHGDITCESDRVPVTLTIYELDEITISYDLPEFCQETGGIAPVTIDGELLNSSQATFSDGHIPTDFTFRTTADDSNCPGTLTVPIPLGSVITSVDVEYNMSASGGHYLSDQHSQLRCISPNGTSEEEVFIGVGNDPGTYSYSRSDLRIANDVVDGGDIVFELHAGRAFNPSPQCSSDGNRVDNNTWTVTVNYTAGHYFEVIPSTGLAIDTNTGDIDLENSDPGTYEVIYHYTDGNCDGSTSTTVTILPQPAPPVVADLEVCEDGDPHTITATHPAGTTLVWYENETGFDTTTAPSGSEAGEYSAWAAVINADGCESDRVQATLTIQESPATPTPQNVTVCFDGTEYTAGAIVEEGVNLIWYENQTGDVLSSAPSATDPGTYNAWAAAELDGCESERVEVILTINDVPDAPIANNENACFTGDSVEASATPPSGAVIVWYANETGDEPGNAPSGVNPGIYTAWAAAEFTATGCESERTLVTLEIFPLPEATISYGAENFCPEGTVDIIITPGEDTEIDFGTFSEEPETGLDINEDTGTINLGNSTPGTYEIEYRFQDVNGCFNTAITTITIDELPDAPEANDTEVCFDGTEHTATATPPAGTTIVWYANETGDETSEAPSGTAPGTYSAWAAAVGVDSGCESERIEVTLIINDTPEEPVANNVTVCFDGEEHTATATVAAETTLVWYTTQFGDVETTAPTGTDPDSYSAWAAAVDDVTGCESERTLVTLTINELPDTPIANDTTVCFDGNEHSASASAPEGTTLVWYTTEFGEETTEAPSGTDPDTYSAWAAAIDEDTGCESERTLVTLVINDTPALPVANNEEECFTGDEFMASATPPAGASIVWYTEQFGGEITTAPTGTDPETYTAWAAAVDDITGCESERVEVTLVIFPLPEVTISYGAENFCPVGTVEVALETDDVISFGTFSVEPQFGLDINEDTGTINLANSAPGTYEIEFRFVDENNCFNTTTTIITIDEVPAFASITPSDAICAGEATGSITVEASAGELPYTFELLDEDLNVLQTIVATTTDPQTFTDLATGSYYVQVTDNNSCGSGISDLILIDEPNPIAIDPTSINITNVTCNGLDDGSISLSANGGSGELEFVLLSEGNPVQDPQTGNANFSDLAPGTYVISITDEALCSVLSEEFTITEPDALLLTAETNPDIVCPEDEAIIEASASQGTAPYTFTLWSGGVQVNGPLTAGEDEMVFFSGIDAPGLYTVMATDANDCETTEDVEVSEPLLLDQFNVMTVGDNAYCSGGEGVEIILDGSETGVNYQLLYEGTNTGAPVPGTGDEISFGLHTEEGNYSVQATHPESTCSTMMTGSVDVIILPLPIAFNVTGGGEYCDGGAGAEIGLDGSETDVNYTLIFNDNDTLTTLAGTGNALSFGIQTQIGNYTVWAVNEATGCENMMSGSATIDEQELPMVYNVTGGGNYCEFGDGVEVGLDNSQTDVNYALFVDDTATGDIVAGTGSAISFGLQTTPGTYTVIATDTTTGCFITMSGEAVIGLNSLPITYNVTGGGEYCDGGEGVEIGLDGSETGINYFLILDGNPTGEVISGTGNPVSFGIQPLAGIYTVVAETEDTGCEADMTGQAEVEILPLPDAPIAVDETVCFDGSEQTATATAPAGASIVWYTDETGDTPGTQPTATDAGEYTAWAASVDDITSCESERTPVTLTILALPEATISYGADVFCQEGSVDVIIETEDIIDFGTFSAEPQFGLSIDSDTGTIDLASSDPGTYEVEYRLVDENGCFNTATTMVTIGEGPAISIVATTDAICAGEASGTITVEASQGLLPYTYELLDEDLNVLQTIVATSTDPQTFEGISFGNYFVRVTDDNSCGSGISDLIFIDEPDPITIDSSSINVSDITCNGLDNGSVSLSANGGSGELAYFLLSGGDTLQGPQTGNANFTGLEPGTYLVSIIDEAMCNVLSEEFILTEPEALLVTAQTITDIVCPGDEATIEASATQGTEPYEFTLWLNETEVEGPLTANEGENVVFSGITDSGLYEVRVSDANNCSSAAETNVSEPVMLAVFDVTGGGAYCEGGEGAEIMLEGSEAGINYQLLLDGAPEGDILSGTGDLLTFGFLAQPGIYTVMAIDPVSGCELTMNGSAEIEVLPLPDIFTVTGGGEFCEDADGVEIGLDGSVTGIDYTLILNDTDTLATLPGTDSAISFGLQTEAGTYTVGAINTSTGCTIMMDGQAEITLNSLPVAAIEATATEVCDGGIVTLTASGGDSYLWTAVPEYDFEGNENNEVIEVVMNETTTFTLTAYNDCGSDQAEVTLSVVPAPVVDLGEDLFACEGETVVLDAGEFDNVSYEWSDESTGQTLEVTESGTYWVEVTNLDNQCFSYGEVTVTFHPLPLALVAEDQTICAGDTVNIGVEDDFTPVPNNTYLWTSEPEDPSLIDPTASNPQVNPLVTTTYTLVETYTESGCTNSNTVTISVVDVVADAGDDQVVCEGEATIIGPEEVSSEWTYSWTSSNPEEEFDVNSPNPEVSPVETTTYTLLVQHIKLGCTSEDNVTVTVSPTPLADAGEDQDICLGESVTIGTEYTDPMPPNTYQWISEPEDESISDPTISNPTVSPQETTTYTLIETYTLTGCTNQNSVVVTVHENPDAQVIEDTEVCADAAINLGSGSEEEGLTYSWTSIPSGFFSNEANPEVTPGLYTLDNNSQITFILEVSNDHCTDIAQVVVTVNPLPVVEIADDMTYCSAEEAANQSIGGDAIPGYSYSWTSNQDEEFTSTEANPEVSPTVSTVYTVVVTDNQTGCVATGEVAINISDLRFVNVSNPAICEAETLASLGDNITVEGGMTPYQYFWTDNDGNSVSNELNPTIEGPFAESYSLMVMDAMGCFITGTIQIDFIESPEVSIHINNMLAGNSHSIYPGQTVNFEALPADYALYEWYVLDPETDDEDNNEDNNEDNDEDNNENDTKEEIANARLVQSGSFNTWSTSELIGGEQVFVVAYDEECPGISQFVAIVLNELPNAFTPDEDGINDIFGEGAELTIFNRWGQKVYEGTSGWDGTFNGKKVSPGTYYYLLNIYDENNEKTTVKGSVTVVLQE